MIVRSKREKLRAELGEQGLADYLAERRAAYRPASFYAFVDAEGLCKAAQRSAFTPEHLARLGAGAVERCSSMPPYDEDLETGALVPPVYDAGSRGWKPCAGMQRERCLRPALRALCSSLTQRLASLADDAEPEAAVERAALQERIETIQKRLEASRPGRVL